MSDFFRNIEDIRILVVGDILLDKYIYGRVDRISPEAPVPILTASSTTYYLGGAGNVARNIRSLGAKVLLAGSIGSDPAADLVRELSNLHGIDTALVPCLEETETKTRLVSGTHQVFRYDLGDVPGRQLVPGSLALQLSGDFDMVVISDYGKGVISEGVVDMLRGFDLPMVVDPKPRNFHLYRGVTVLTPNREEVLRYGEVGESFEELSRKLSQDLDSSVLATLGRSGMVLVDDDQCLEIPGFRIEEADPTGAGDVVTASLSLSLASGKSLEEGARFANRAAALSVSKTGTCCVTLEEVQRSFREFPES